MTLWIAVIVAGLLSFALKVSGYLVPVALLDRPRVARVVPLLPVALLSALVVTQAFVGSGGTPVLDARAAGVAVAVLALLARAPFLLVVVLAAAAAALVRLAGG